MFEGDNTYNHRRITIGDNGKPIPAPLRPLEDSMVDFKRNRRKEIKNAIDRYIEADYEVPIEWINELNQLTRDINKSRG